MNNVKDPIVVAAIANIEAIADLLSEILFVQLQEAARPLPLEKVERQMGTTYDEATLLAHSQMSDERVRAYAQDNVELLAASACLSASARYLYSVKAIRDIVQDIFA